MASGLVVFGRPAHARPRSPVRGELVPHESSPFCPPPARRARCARRLLCCALARAHGADDRHRGPCADGRACRRERPRGYPCKRGRRGASPRARRERSRRLARRTRARWQSRAIARAGRRGARCALRHRMSRFFIDGARRRAPLFPRGRRRSALWIGPRAAPARVRARARLLPCLRPDEWMTRQPRGSANIAGFQALLSEYPVE